MSRPIYWLLSPTLYDAFSFSGCGDLILGHLRKDTGINQLITNFNDTSIYIREVLCPMLAVVKVDHDINKAISDAKTYLLQSVEIIIKDLLYHLSLGQRHLELSRSICNPRRN